MLCFVLVSSCLALPAASLPASVPGEPAEALETAESYYDPYRHHHHHRGPIIIIAKKRT